MADPKKSKAPDPPLKRKKLKAKHGGGHHGGAWKVAYADFITTMMALFLLLWLLSAADQQTKNIIALYFKDPGVFDNAQGQNILSGTGSSKISQAVPIAEVVGHSVAGQGGSETALTMQDVEKALKSVLHNVGPNRGKEQQVIFTPTNEGMLVQVVDSGDKPLFPPGRTNLMPQGQTILEQLGSILALLDDFDVVLSGHTDGQPFSQNALYTNWDLSLDRAQEAGRVLMAAGVPVQRIRSVTGYGDTRPLNPDDPNDPKNRRISILVKRRPGREQPVVAPEAERPPGAAVPGGGAVVAPLEGGASTEPSTASPGAETMAPVAPPTGAAAPVPPAGTSAPAEPSATASPAAPATVPAAPAPP